MPRKSTAGAVNSNVALNTLTSPQQFERAANMAMFLNTTLIVHGPPGVGKSDIINQLVARSAFAVGELGVLPCAALDWRMVSKQAEDMTGLPLLDPETRTTERTLPALVSATQRLAYQDASDPTKQTHIPVIVFDEYNTGSDRAAFQSLMEVALDRRLDAFPLPPGTRVIMLGNTPDHGVDVMDTPLPLIDRTFVFSYVPFSTPESVDQWADYAESQGCHPLIVNAIRADNTLLRDFDNNRDRNASPRGWLKSVSPLLHTLQARHQALLSKAAATKELPVTPETALKAAIADEMFQPLLASRVGDNAALRFMGIAREYGQLYPPMDIVCSKLSPDQIPDAFPKHKGDTAASVRNIMQCHTLVGAVATAAHSDRALAWIEAHMPTMVRSCVLKLSTQGVLSPAAVARHVTQSKGGAFVAADSFDA